MEYGKERGENMAVVVDTVRRLSRNATIERCVIVRPAYYALDRGALDCVVVCRFFFFWSRKPCQPFETGNWQFWT